MKVTFQHLTLSFPPHFFWCLKKGGGACCSIWGPSPLIPCLIVFVKIFHRHPAKTFNVSKVKSTMLVWCSVFVIYTCKSNTGALCFCWKEKQTENNRGNHRAVPAVQGFVQRRGRVSGRELSKFPWTSYKREPQWLSWEQGQRGLCMGCTQTEQAACFGWERCIWLDLVFSPYHC